MTFFRTCAVVALSALLSCEGGSGKAPPSQAAPPQDGARPTGPALSQVNETIVEPGKLGTLTGFRLSADGDYASQPAVAAGADGTVWAAWVRYREGQGDEVVVRGLQFAGRDRRVPARILPPQALSPGAGQYVRPVLAAAGADVWCFWTATHPERTSTIWYSRRSGSAWSPAARLLPEEKRPHQNPELAGRGDGTLAVAYQVHTGKGYAIHARLHDKSWGGPSPWSDGSTDDWDPAAAYDAAGKLHVVWSGYRDGDYDVYWKSGPGPVRRISARGEYDLHPWLAAAPDGKMWLCWDVVRISNHSGSGASTITGANLRGRPNGGEVHSSVSEWSGIEVRVLDGDRVGVPGRPREEIVAPQGYRLTHRGLGKVALGPKGEPWIVYRVLLRTRASWSGQVRDGYLWELQARPFRDGRWQEPQLFLDSDGYLEEPGVAVTVGGIRVVYTTEHRRTSARRVGFHEPHGEEYDHHHDFDGFAGWKGDAYLGTLEPASASIPAAFPVEERPADRPVESYVPREAGHHEGRSGGRTYRLYWGDTHKHSNLSRCSVGAEPTPEDLYRYGMDVNRYSFFALSDHSEYTTDFYWWRQQKMADLYHLPGFMSVLYNSEWSLRFPAGHHNTVFPSRPTVKMHGWMGATKTLKGGWRLLEKNNLKAITIPHTGADPGMGTDWSSYDARYLRVCEIFQSCRGSYEHAGCPREYSNTRNKKGFYWNALEKGYHVGVIASSDHGYGVAYACVYAAENSRDAIWQAMWDRRTYGATTYGLVLEFRSGDRWMGEEWSSKEAPPLEIYVRGARPIRSVEILGRSKVLHAEGSLEKPLNAAEHRIRWTDPDWAAQDREQWYYVRVIQVDDEMAWSSPVWVKPEK